MMLITFTVMIAMAQQSASPVGAAESSVEIKITTLSLLIVATTILLNYFLGDLNRYMLQGVELRSKYIMTDKRPKDYLIGTDKTKEIVAIMNDYFRFRFMLARFGFIFAPLVVTFITINCLFALLATALYDVWPGGFYLVACLIIPFLVYEYIFLLHGDVVARRLADLTNRRFEEDCFDIMRNELNQPTPVSAYSLLLYKIMSKPLLAMSSSSKSTFFDAATHSFTVAVILLVVSTGFSTIAPWLALSWVGYVVLFFAITCVIHKLRQRQRNPV